MRKLHFQGIIFLCLGREQPGYSESNEKGEAWKLHAHWRAHWLQPALSNLGEECPVIHRKLKFQRMNLAMQQQMCFSQKAIAMWLRIFSLLILPPPPPFLLVQDLCKTMQDEIHRKKMQHLIVLFLLVPATTFDQ